MLGGAEVKESTYIRKCMEALEVPKEAVAWREVITPGLRHGHSVGRPVEITVGHLAEPCRKFNKDWAEGNTPEQRGEWK
jgi:hypothetical protein